MYKYTQSHLPRENKIGFANDKDSHTWIPLHKNNTIELRPSTAGLELQILRQSLTPQRHVKYGSKQKMTMWDILYFTTLSLPVLENEMYFKGISIRFRFEVEKAFWALPAFVSRLDL